MKFVNYTNPKLSCKLLGDGVTLSTQRLLRPMQLLATESSASRFSGLRAKQEFGFKICVPGRVPYVVCRRVGQRAMLLHETCSAYNESGTRLHDPSKTPGRSN